MAFDSQEADAILVEELMPAEFVCGDKGKRHYIKKHGVVYFETQFAQWRLHNETHIYQLTSKCGLVAPVDIVQSLISFAYNATHDSYTFSSAIQLIVSFACAVRGGYHLLRELDSFEYVDIRPAHDRFWLDFHQPLMYHTRNHPHRNWQRWVVHVLSSIYDCLTTLTASRDTPVVKPENWFYTITPPQRATVFDDSFLELLAAPKKTT